MGNRDRDLEKQDENINSKDFMIGALIGGLVGGLAALLLAPKSGREMRSTLNEQTSSLMDKTEKLKDTAVSKGTELASAAKDKASSLSQTVTEQSSGLLNKVKGSGENTDPNSGPEGNLQEVPTSMAETSTMEQTHIATGEEVQKKLEETQKAFDDTEGKLNE